MTSSTDKLRSLWVTFLAHLFLVLVAWTIFIKYLFPIGFALAANEAWTSYIYWDLWPVAHLWLAWALLAQPPYTRLLAASMAVVEIVIIATLFIGFLSDPEWSIWRTNWFVNKVFVLIAVVLVLGTVLFRPHSLVSNSQSPARESGRAG